MKHFEPSELIINNDGSAFHLHITPEQLAQKVILVGDPGRVSLVASHFTNIECDVQSREAGKKLFVHHIEGAEAGQAVEFEKVLLVDNNGNITVGAPAVDGAKVTAEVVSPLVKGEKVLVFHKKRRKGYRKLNGHRQQFTELTIKEVIA